MKAIVRSILLIGFGISLTASAQVGNNPANPADPKADFVKNQGYLAPNYLKDLNAYYGDSLGGFDEAGAKATMLAHSVYGEEFLNHMKVLKRDFINKKYGIGPPPAVPIPAPTPGGGAGGKNIGGGAVVNVTPCINEGFESTPTGTYTGASNSLAITGWTISSLYNNSCGLTSFTPGSPKIYVKQTPILTTGVPILTSLGNSPLGGSQVVQMHDITTVVGGGYYTKTKLAQTFPVTNNNTLFQFAYAGVYYDGGHACCEQPALQIQMYSCSLTPLACSSLSLNATGALCSNTANATYTITNGYSWTNWTVKYIDLTPFIGSCITIEVINTDCIWGGHWAVTWFDAMCGGQLVGTGINGYGGSVAGPVSFCSGANQALINAPLGYNSYQWYGPGAGPSNPGPAIAAPAGTQAALTVSNPVLGSVYTVDLTTPSGCVFVATNTLSYTQVNIAGLGTTTSCIGGASGSATVVGNGSGTGYSYNWLNASNQSLSTTSVVTGLAPGLYSVVISGLGATGCGSAVATVTITDAPPPVQNILKPYCGTQAFLGVNGGSNFRWYNSSLALITGSLGSGPTYTVNNPTNNSSYYLAYTSQFGCLDSLKYIMVGTTPGLIVVPPAGIKLICLGASNGTATINMSPANGAPSGFNSYSVTSTGTMAAYNSFLFPTSSNVYTVGGLSAGTYSVNAFDGSCKYSTTFNVVPYVFDYTVTPNTPTLCPGNSIPANLTFTSPPSPTQYSYSWTPTTWLVGNNGSLQNTIITPTVPVGSVVPQTYTITVTPTIAICPLTKTLQITAVNPPIPTITAIQNLCDVSSPYTIQVNPAGGNFINSSLTPTLISNSGVISPTNAIIGTNTFTYAISVSSCVATNTSNFIVSKFYPATLTSSVPALCVTNSPFNLMAIVQSSVNGKWIGQGVTSSGPGNYSFNPSTLAGGSYAITYSVNSSPIATTCSVSTTINVSVTNTISPYIEQVLPICNKGPQITMSVTPSGGSWSGSPVISSTGILTPSLALNAGIYNMNYSVAIGPCVNTATTSVNISKFYSAAITGTIPNLCYSSNPFNLMSIVQNTVNGTWSGVGVTGNAFDPTLNLSTGTYTLTYNTTSAPNNLCPGTGTTVVSVLNPPQPVITQINPVCSRESAIQLSVTPATGNWIPAAYLSNAGVFTPSLAAVGNNAVQYKTGNSTCYRSNTKFISVEAFVPATITSQLPDICNTSPAINLTPYTLSNLGIWSGTGISGTSFNPSSAGQGSFALTYKTASSPSGLCPDQATVAINVYSLATPVVASISPVCNNAMPIKIQANPPGGLFGGANTTAVDNAGLFSPGAGIIGKNVINYSITSGPCVAFAQTTVNVVKFVSADLEKSLKQFCHNDAPVNLDSYAQSTDGYWTGTGVVGSNMFHPDLTAEGQQVSVSVTHHTYSYPEKDLCPDEKTFQINILGVPKVTALATPNGKCAPVEVQFYTPSVSEGNGVGVWNVGDGSEPQEGVSAYHVYKTPGTYYAVFSYSNDIGCATHAEVVQSITVYDVPSPNFSVPDEILISSPQVQLNNLTAHLGDNTYSWKVEGLDVPQEVNPTVNFPKIGKYQVTLTAQNMHDCSNSITKTIEVKNDFNIFIPTSFSPNFDGLNDEFKPVFTEYGLDLKSYEMEIFDRWGHTLYRTKDVNKGWDGSINNKGEPLKEEVYVYRIKYKDVEGNAYTKMGHISLLK